MNKKQLIKLCKNDDWYKRYRQQHLERLCVKIMIVGLAIFGVVGIASIYVATL